MNTTESITDASDKADASNRTTTSIQAAASDATVGSDTQSVRGGSAVCDPEGRIVIQAPTGDAMRALGRRVAATVRGGDVILLSGPLGAGKTTFAQGFGEGLGIGEAIVSPTFTIARELHGRFADGTPAHLVHVDAYRLGGSDYAPGQAAVDRLLDELESLGLDEELEDTGDDTVVLMEWGEQMAAALAPERLEIHIERPLDVAETPGDCGPGPDSRETELTENGMRIVTFVAVGARWTGFAI